MPADIDGADRRPKPMVNAEAPELADVPTTPLENDAGRSFASQGSIPPTEGPESPPVDPSHSFKTELNDDRVPSSQVIPSSLTPPPSSQVANNNTNNNGPAAFSRAYANSQRSHILSPPVTGLNSVRRELSSPAEFVVPTPQQVVEAPPEELRSMLQACIAEHAKLKMESAHHKLQYNLLSLQAEEDANRAAVEHDMTRREVDVLRKSEQLRTARRELSTANESAQAKYLQLKIWYNTTVEENENLQKKLKAAKKIIQQKEEMVNGLTDDREMLLTRIRENREHFHMLCSPGGIFHGALTPKTQTASTPVQHRATPRQTPRVRVDRDQGQEPFAALLQALNHENNSAPSTPITGHRPPPRVSSKHTRNVQSMSSLPTTPMNLAHGGLLPSVDLVPQTEPPHRYNGNRFPRVTPSRSRERRRKSRESTISADDNEELARQALESVAAGAISFASRASGASRRQDQEEEEVFESQASQAASEMLRRDPRESFDVASSVGSRDGTPAPAEKSARLQAKIFGGLGKSGPVSDKRKFSGNQEARDEVRRDLPMSPSKKLRMAGGLREEKSRVGLGIRY